MLDNWTLIYSAAQSYDAEMIKSIMEENDIECVIMNKKDSTYGFGDIEVYVNTSDVFAAKQIIIDIKGE